MERNRHTTDETGFDFMANTGIEETDRDWVGTVIAVVLMTSLVVFQYFGLY